MSAQVFHLPVRINSLFYCFTFFCVFLDFFPAFLVCSIQQFRTNGIVFLPTFCFALLCFSAVGIGRDYLLIAEGMSKAD